jgi:hypothetical protein
MLTPLLASPTHSQRHLMDVLFTYCKKNNIFLSQQMRKACSSLSINQVYSHYKTSNGWMFYVNTDKGDKFIHLLSKGYYEMEDGWDGGNLSSLDVVKRYMEKTYGY